MKIVLWIGNEANQKALANKIHHIFPVSGIVAENRKRKRKITVIKLIEAVIEKIFFRKISGAWQSMLNDYHKKYIAYPETEWLLVENINSEKVYEFTKNLNPDLIVVSGTRLIKSKLLSIRPAIGIINLHTGLSPYIKGGPNCTNWCLATGQFHLIGNTVMWIDEGIDTGNLIATGLTAFTGKESLAQVHLKVMEHAHDLYCRSIVALVKGKRPNVRQEDIGTGKTFYNKQWGLKNKFWLIRNFRKFRKVVNTEVYREMREKIKTVNL
jgi:methionyl-tRNA formyltransferase